MSGASIPLRELDQPMLPEAADILPIVGAGATQVCTALWFCGLRAHAWGLGTGWAGDRADAGRADSRCAASPEPR